MARSEKDILQEINEATGREAALVSLQNNTSRVSFWQAIKRVVTVAIRTLEQTFEAHRREIADTIARQEVGTPRWYRQKALQFQYGDAPVVSDSTITYNTRDDSKRTVKHAAVAEGAGTLIIKAVKARGGTPEPLNAVEKEALDAYMQAVRFAGLSLTIRSEAADKLYLRGSVEVDTQQLTTERQFKDWLDSFLHKDDPLGNLLLDFADATQATSSSNITHVMHPRAVYLALLHWGARLEYPSLNDAFNSMTKIAAFLIRHLAAASSASGGLWNPDGQGNVITFNDGSLTIGSTHTAAHLILNGDGIAGAGGLKAKNIEATGYLKSTAGLYVGATQVIDSSGRVVNAGEVAGTQVTGTPLWKPQQGNDGKVFRHSTTPLSIGDQSAQGAVFVAGVGAGSNYDLNGGGMQTKLIQAERMAASDGLYVGSGGNAKRLQVDSQGYADVQHLGDSEVREATLNEPSLHYRYNGLSSLTLQVKLKKGIFHAVREGRKVTISGLFYPYSTATQLNSTTPAAFNFKKPNAGGGLLLYYDAANSSRFEQLFTFGSSNSTLFPQHIALLRGENIQLYLHLQIPVRTRGKPLPA